MFCKEYWSPRKTYKNVNLVDGGGGSGQVGKRKRSPIKGELSKEGKRQRQNIMKTLNKRHHFQLSRHLMNKLHLQVVTDVLWLGQSIFRRPQFIYGLPLSPPLIGHTS